jgi:hypothetical protein
MALRLHSFGLTSRNYSETACLASHEHLVAVHLWYAVASELVDFTPHRLGGGRETERESVCEKERDHTHEKAEAAADNCVVCDMITWQAIVHSDHSLVLQARIKAVAEIVSKLIEGVTAGKDVNLNDIKRDATLRYQVCCLHVQCFRATAQPSASRYTGSSHSVCCCVSARMKSRSMTN